MASVTVFKDIFELVQAEYFSGSALILKIYVYIEREALLFTFLSSDFIHRS